MTLELERKQAAEISNAVLEGRLSIIEGTRALVPFAHTEGIANETDRRTIIGIESETDDLPVGEVRGL